MTVTLPFRTDTGVSDDPIGDALEVLKYWGDSGVHLTRRHVETAARMTGARFSLLYDIVLSPATR